MIKEINTNINKNTDDEFKMKLKTKKSFLIHVSILILLLFLTTVFSTTIFSTTVFASDFNYASSEEKTVFNNLLDDYYSSFGEKNLDNYLETQFLNHLSKEELDAKKVLIKKMWNKYNSGYSLDNQEDWTYLIDGPLALVEFDLYGNLMDHDWETIETYDERMTALMFETEEGWKIFNIVPTSVFDFNSVMNLINNNSNDFVEEQTPNNISNDFSDKNVSNPLKRGIEDGSCDDQGRCFKRGPALINKQKAHCSINYAKFKDTKGYSLEDIPGVNNLIGEDSLLKISIDDSYEIFYRYKEGFLKPEPATEKVDYSVITDSCTLQRIDEGSNPQLEYEEGNIIIKGETIGPKIKATLGKMIFEIYSWFSSPSFELWIEGEEGELHDEGRYSFIGPTSRGPGELYLGTGGSYATYEFESDFSGEANLYILISDDAIHASGSRNALFTVNDKNLEYNHVSKNTVTEDGFWAWEYLGKVNLIKGINKVKILKPKQTSAAFIMDKMVFSQKELSLK